MVNTRTFVILLGLILGAAVNLGGCIGTPTPQIIYIEREPEATQPYLVNGQPSTNNLSPQEAQSQAATAEFGRLELEKQLTAIANEEATQVIPEPRAPAPAIEDKCAKQDPPDTNCGARP